MIIINQHNTAAVFLGSGNMICIKPISKKNNSGDKTTSYFIFFYNPNGNSCVMGVYEDLKTATDKFNDLVDAYCTYKNRENYIYRI